MKQYLEHVQGVPTLLQRDHKISDDDCYNKETKLFGQEHRKQDKARNEPFPVLSQLWKQLFRNFISCRCLRECKRQPAGCSVSQGRDTKGWEVQPQSTFCNCRFLSSISAEQFSTDQGLTLHQEATRVLAMGLMVPYCFQEHNLLPSLGSHCHCAYQGLTWNQHGGLLHDARPSLEDLP